MRQKTQLPFLYAAIFFLTCGTLIFELSLVRLFSIALWYHFAFLVVSIAMLGLGAAGSILAIFPNWLRRDSHKQLANLAFFYSLAVIICYLIVNHIPFDQKRMSWDFFQFFYLFLYYIVLAVPPFLAGLILSSVYTNYSQQISKFYFFDILGAAIGSLAVLKVTAFANGLGGIATAAGCGIISSCLLNTRVFSIVLKVLSFGFIIAIWLFKPSLFSLNLSEYKALRQLLRPPNSKILYTDWSPSARIDFVQSPMVHFAPGLSLTSYSALPDQIGVVVDGGHLNAVTKFNGDIASLTFVNNLPSALPYHISKISSVLICEPLGGLDFLTALYFNVPDIDGAGIYNRIAKITKDKFHDFSGGLFTNFPIDVKAMSPRAFLTQTLKKYDLISLPISDSFGAASTGIYGPAEEYLFTVESFVEYLQHLSENGWLSVSCYILPPLRQELRLMSMAVTALEKSKKPQPEKHIIAIRTLETFSILIKSNPVNQHEIGALKIFCEERGFDLVYYPKISTEELNRFNRFDRPIFFEALTAILNDSTRKQLYESYLFDVQPTTDDRPFFGHFFRRDKLREEFENLGRRWTAFFEGGYLVAVLFIQACLFTAVFIILPLLIKRNHKHSNITRSNRTAILSYFFSIGLAYMLIEIVLIQRFILVMEHPLYAASAVIASLLISSACGSYLSSKITPSSSWSILKHLIVLCLLLAVYLFFLSRILNSWMGHNLINRYLFTALLIAIPGFLMGFPFPVGIRTLGKMQKQLIPWAYCANASASVVGSSLAVLVALEMGFTWVMGIAAGFYFLAAMVSLKWIGR